MDWIEIIHLRAFSASDNEGALAAFGQLTQPERDPSLKEIVMLRSCVLTLDLSILIIWQGQVCPNAKSPLGLRLAAAFSEFGQIHHSTWARQANVQARNQEPKR